LHNIVSFLVIALSVAVIIIALAISNGFEKALIDKIIVASPQVSVFGAYEEIQIPQKIKVKESIVIAQVQALSINPENKRVQGVLLRGASPEQIPELFKNKDVLEVGVYPNEEEVVIGNKLAEASGLFVGDKVKVLTGPAIFKEFQISGIFKVGLYDFDSTVMVGTFEDVVSLAPMPGEGIASEVTEFKAFWLENPFQAVEISNEIQQLNPEAVVTNWQEDNKSLVSAIALEKKIIFIVLLLLVVATSVAIANSQFIQIISQREQIAILSAIGFTPDKVLWTFIYESILIGVIGSIGGIILSLLVVYYLGNYPISLPMDVYQVEIIPVEVQNMDILLTAFAAVIMVCLSSMIPAFYASRLDPVEILRRV
jgi:lipoprotein-releasing system permease protein